MLWLRRSARRFEPGRRRTSARPRWLPRQQWTGSSTESRRIASVSLLVCLNHGQSAYCRGVTGGYVAVTRGLQQVDLLQNCQKPVVVLDRVEHGINLQPDQVIVV